jgi:alpha-ketoglutaric semialdehyde dehydrogenase
MPDTPVGSDLLGLSLLGHARATRGGRTFTAHAATGSALTPEVQVATREEVERACRLAAAAAGELARSSAETRAALLEAIAAALERVQEAIVTRAQLETALPLPRLTSELGRTTGQLRFFAAIVREGSWVDARIDRADAQRVPLPRPDLRSLRVPVGPTVVFGASNFPLAFSAAGGDTASALAAGNPVIVKAHPAHPGTSELAGLAIAAAVREHGLPEGTFSLLFDDGFEVGQALVLDPRVRAVGFTGSRAGGMALVGLAATRPEPIPVYAEMGSVNPVVFLPGALAARGSALADGLHASFTLGVGQFCTNPGLVFVPSGVDGDAFVARLAERTAATPAGTMLTPGIASAYARGVARATGAGARVAAEGAPGDGRAVLLTVDAAAANPELLEEVFGPSTLVARFGDDRELEETLAGLGGQLTASVHATPDDLARHPALIERLGELSGRLVFDQFPTGVEVGHAMVHGGPFPASSDGRSTSVGARAIERFTRPRAWQNAPQTILPPELRDENPRGIWRRVDGQLTREPL